MEKVRKIRGQPHVVDYFHDTADPYSHLTAQLLPALQERYNISLRPHLISGPPEWAVPARASLANYSLLDAKRVARKTGLEFPAAQNGPSQSKIAKAEALISSALDSPDFGTVVQEASATIWQSGPLPINASASVSDAKRQGDAQLSELGHYLGATFHYGGEWYWGVDRLHYLENRLCELGLSRTDAHIDPIIPPLQTTNIACTSPKSIIEMFASFRSPYTYLAFDRIRQLAEAHGAELVIRPVLPMVMRGLSVPRSKKTYILHDAAREARRMNIPFGRICDPLGLAVERGCSLIGYARNQDRAANYFGSFLRGVWADGIDAKTDTGLAYIVERAGLDWGEAKGYLKSSDWQSEVEANRKELTDIGLWGVPSFRCNDTVVWGQDRLWVLEDLLNAKNQ